MMIFPLVVGSTFLFVVGILFALSYFTRQRKAGFLIVGAVLTCLGFGLLLASTVIPSEWAIIAVVASLGLALVSTWVVDRRQLWALILGVIVLPALVIVIGVWLLWQRSAGGTAKGKRGTLPG